MPGYDPAATRDLQYHAGIHRHSLHDIQGKRLKQTRAQRTIIVFRDRANERDVLIAHLDNLIDTTPLNNLLFVTKLPIHIGPAVAVELPVSSHLFDLI